MPSFEKMKSRIDSNFTIGNQIKKMSNIVFDETFSNSTTYRKGMIYTSDLEEIEEIEFKFIKVKTFSFGKNQVEYWIQFKTGVNPEIDYDKSKDQKHRLGFYIDILDDNTKKIEKWIIVGKDQSEFDRYNVLKCDWEFEWIDKKRKYHKCLGCIMEANSYNNGTSNDSISTVVDNIATFVFPTNEDTKYLDYNTRFMIADSKEHPKTYEITKITDTSPFGVTKGSLSQTLFNEHNDLCEEIDIGDGRGKVMHMICDYFDSSIPPIINDDNEIQWKLVNSSTKLYIKGQPQTIKAISNVETNKVCKWHLFIDDKEYTIDELTDYFDIKTDEDNILIISAINEDMAKYIIKISISDESGLIYYDSVEMEVIL